MTITPILEEILVVEKRLTLKEELHIRQYVDEALSSQEVTLQIENVVLRHREATPADQDQTPHTVWESVGKDHGRLEIRRCYAFTQLQCLPSPEQWPGLASFAVIESERQQQGKTSTERRLYISSLPADAQRLG